MPDFTLQKYKELCVSITSSDYEAITVARYLSVSTPPEKFIIVRHDVDRKPDRAETMALIESELGVKATYYFRKNSYVFIPDIIKRISSLGHEIGYHYEVLDKAKGNIEKAYSIFKEELAVFRDIVDIKTVSMHGNPLTRWINVNFWENCDIKEFSLIGDASLSIKDKNVIYYTDTGRNWFPIKHNIKDFISNSNGTARNNVRNTDDLIDLISKLNGECRLYLSIHPNRWNDDAMKWLLQYTEDSLENMVKRVIKLWAAGF